MSALVMTRRQEAIWGKRMVKREEEFIAYLRRNPDEVPDGSFMMRCFKDGYWTRAGKEARLELARKAGA